jgi:hypothetical protein
VKVKVIVWLRLQHRTRAATVIAQLLLMAGEFTCIMWGSGNMAAGRRLHMELGGTGLSGFLQAVVRV